MSLPASIPDTSLAATQDPQTLIITTTTRSTPVPSPSQVLVRIAHCGLCAADLHLARRHLPYLLPRPGVSVFGHEGAGIIAALPPSPPSADPESRAWKVGDRVGIRFLHSVCSQPTCEPCSTSHSNLCPSRIVTGRDLDGALAQYAVADPGHLVPLPEAVSDADAAPVLCAGVTVYKALRVAALPPSSPDRKTWVVVAGAGGGLGHLAVQYARAMGFAVLGVDAADKRAFIEGIGVDAYVSLPEAGAAAAGEDGDDVVSQVIRRTDGGAHCALVCASSARAYADAVGYLRRAGALVCVGAPARTGSRIPVGPEDFISRGIRVLGSSTGTVTDTEEALAFVARGEVRPRIEIRDLDDVEAALGELEAGKVLGRVVVRMP